MSGWMSRARSGVRSLRTQVLLATSLIGVAAVVVVALVTSRAAAREVADAAPGPDAQAVQAIAHAAFDPAAAVTIAPAVASADGVFTVSAAPGEAAILRRLGQLQAALASPLVVDEVQFFTRPDYLAVRRPETMTLSFVGTPAAEAVPTWGYVESGEAPGWGAGNAAAIPWHVIYDRGSGSAFLRLDDRLARSFGDDPGEAMGDLNRNLALTVLGSAGMTVLIGFVASRRIAAPLEQVTRAAEALGRGDLDQRVAGQSGGEVGALARAFNGMAEGLQEQERLRRMMVSDIAHELRTPLTNLVGHLDALSDGVIEPAPEVFESLQEEAGLLARLVRDLNELAEGDAGTLALEPEPIDLGELLEHGVAAVEVRARHTGIEVVANIPDEDLTIVADPHRLAQVFRNLMDNAIRHTPSGGRVEVSAARIGGEIRFAVRDTGEGIAPEHLPYIFERFYRVDPSRSRITGGRGLGLAVARQLVEAHGGRIEASSVPGGGATFTASLPES